MTPKQRQAERAKRAARKARERARIDRRKAKRAAKAAPKNALAAWSREIRCDGKCVVCGRTEYLQAHHLLDKYLFPQFRTHLMNGVCVCPKCHKYSAQSFHKNGIWATLWLRAHLPEQYKWVKEQLEGLWGRGLDVAGPAKV